MIRTLGIRKTVSGCQWNNWVAEEQQQQQEEEDQKKKKKTQKQSYKEKAPVNQKLAENKP